MSEYSFVIVKYTGPKTASEALDIVLGLSKDKQIDLEDAVAVYKTEDGRVKLAQGKSMTTGKGLTRGGVIGLILGIVLTGGVLAWTLAGAVLGGVWGRVRDTGIKDTLMKELGEGMNVSDSALCLLITEASLDLVEQRLAHLNGNVVKTAMSDDALAAFDKLADDDAVSSAAAEEMESE